MLQSTPALACSCRDKITSVKSNMHTLQTMLETYAVDYRGVYPASLRALQIEALQKDYWREMTNPYISQRGLYSSVMPFKAFRKSKPVSYVHQEGGLFGLRLYLWGPPPQPSENFMAGKVFYDVKPDQLGYFIYGTTIRGRLIRDRGTHFTLSNS